MHFSLNHTFLGFYTGEGQSGEVGSPILERAVVLYWGIGIYKDLERLWDFLGRGLTAGIFSP